mmetsp:Transcript_16490/g.21097  ORF Transcript_16490/g.21097 Transcript_16490/m.21097 type:complete len:265 (+) Transcript_16490:60-854(+)
MLDFINSVAVITGGASGIGYTLAQSWLEHGGNVVLADISEEALNKAKNSLAKYGENVSTIVCNVTNEDDCAKMAALAIERYGSLNLVAPFAGIIKDGMMIDIDRTTKKVSRVMSLDKFKSVIDINLTGVFLSVRECLKQMIDNNCTGSICLVSSTGSLGTAGQLNYSSTKAAMAVWPKVITAELFRRGLSDKIRCNAVAPGYVGTPMVKSMNKKALDNILSNVPIKRLIEPREVASLVLETYRNEALSGETFFIHGGLRLSSRG